MNGNQSLSVKIGEGRKEYYDEVERKPDTGVEQSGF